MNTFLTDRFPYDVLSDFGLTREMIEDLPEYVLDTIISGGRSPLLPIVMQTKYGSVSGRAKFRLVPRGNNEPLGVILYPKLKEAPLDSFTEEEKERLLDGKVIIADIKAYNLDDEGTHTEKCFVQLDKDTNHIFCINTPVIARNIMNIDTFVDITAAQMELLKKGEIITVDAEPEPMSIGIDLFSDAGIFAYPGEAEQWKRMVGKAMPKYSFGTEGCWINENGELRYVKEEDFDATIKQACEIIAQANARHAKPSEQPEENRVMNEELREEETSQLSR